MAGSSRRQPRRCYPSSTFHALCRPASLLFQAVYQPAHPVTLRQVLAHNLGKPCTIVLDHHIIGLYVPSPHPPSSLRCCISDAILVRLCKTHGGSADPAEAVAAGVQRGQLEKLPPPIPMPIILCLTAKLRTPRHPTQKNAPPFPLLDPRYAHDVALCYSPVSYLCVSPPPAPSKSRISARSSPSALLALVASLKHTDATAAVTHRYALDSEATARRRSPECCLTKVVAADPVIRTRCAGISSRVGGSHLISSSVVSSSPGHLT
ncbi:unnamed protein product [Cutaneotrichosporon oleaginosum]